MLAGRGTRSRCDVIDMQERSGVRADQVANAVAQIARLTDRDGNDVFLLPLARKAELVGANEQHILD